MKSKEVFKAVIGHSVICFAHTKHRAQHCLRHSENFGAASLAKRNGGETTAVAEAKTTYPKGRERRVGKNMPPKARRKPIQRPAMRTPYGPYSHALGAVVSVVCKHMRLLALLVGAPGGLEPGSP